MIFSDYIARAFQVTHRSPRIDFHKLMMHLGSCIGKGTAAGNINYSQWKGNQPTKRMIIRPPKLCTCTD